MLKFHRILIAYAVAIPLALMVGYLVATPDMASVAVVGMVVLCLALPLVIQWSHPVLLFCWNSALIVGFLPGSLPLWMIFAGLTFGMGLVHRLMGHRNFLHAPELSKPILFITVVVVLTGRIRGGLGMRLLGSSSYGGKYYFYVLIAIMGYYALTSQRISVVNGARAAKWYFLSGITWGVGNLIYVLGPVFYVLYYFIAPDFAYGQASADFNEGIVKRFGGLGPTGSALICFVFARWGLRGVFDLSKPWRLLLLMAALTAGLFSGFRSQIAFFGVYLIVQFITEGLWKTAFLPVLCAVGFLGLIPLLMFTNRMPAAVQRSLAAFPVDIDPNVRAEAESSTAWRWEMWGVVWREVPKYLLLGKGYAIDPVDLYLTSEATRSGLLRGYEEAVYAGDYHNGPLSILMPFGIFGMIGFLWLLGAGIKALYRNYRYGDVRLRQANMALFSFFVTQSLCFFVVFGAFSTELSVFLGVLGVSVSLNGGICRKGAPKAARQTALSSSLAAPVAVA